MSVKLQRTGTLSKDQTDYISTTIKRGYGKVSTAGFSVSGEVTGKVIVDITLTAITNSQVMQVATKFADEYNVRSQFQTENAKYAQTEGFGFLTGLFAIFERDSFKSGMHEQKLNITSKSRESSQRLAKAVAQIQAKKMRAHGQLQVKSNHSFIPSQGQVYVETLTISRRDASGLTASKLGISKKTAAIDQSGNHIGIFGDLDLTRAQ